MTDVTPPESAAPRAGAYGDLMRGGNAVFTVLVVLGTILQALQVQVIAIIMPTVVADLGGTAFYTWAIMLYTLGAIIGSSSIGPVWALFGARRSYALSGVVFLIGTAACALAPNMATLIVARTIQGLAGGLVTGGTFALIGSLYRPALRTRILAITQSTFTIAQLLGPLFGGLFAELGWWRGSFWAVIPVIVVFNTLAFLKVPDHLTETAGPASAPFPVLRLTILATGVFCVAAGGPIDSTPARVLLLVLAVALIWLTFRIDGTASSRLFPTGALSLNSPVGLALWILFITGGVQLSVTLFLPLLLAVVHGVSPFFINFATIVISFGWTCGTFSVSGATSRRARQALLIGPPLMVAGLAAITMSAQLPFLWMLTLGAFVMGFGIGVHNVHLVSQMMGDARAGEERITASAMPTVRSLGTAFGAAMAGMLASIGGLTSVTDPQTVGAAVTFVYGVMIIPMAATVYFMVRLVRINGRA